ncbi:26838_t:CDS:2 [Dentiscutata erythropus]|uniref:26838_t:CDS:1 n=1 Tax=Dentiscutata erythropus TaxID=1348616 RepID=A0A9N9DNK6_9GLOM|nr:26838_t:CDS:2 [Dentiscutata erythropus]
MADNLYDKSVSRNALSNIKCQSASYIRPWNMGKTKITPVMQLYLSTLQIEDYEEKNINSINKCEENYNSNSNTSNSNSTNNNKKPLKKKYGPPKFRYKYLEAKIILYLLQNCQIYIPLQALRGIEKLQEKIMRLIFKEDDNKRLVEFIWGEGYTRGKKTVILDNFNKASSITLVVHQDVPEKEIDIAGLHIDYLINKTPTNDGIRTTPSWGYRWTFNHNSFNINEHYIIKLHTGNDIRIFLFKKLQSYKEIKSSIESAINVRSIKNFKYKDDVGEFITISTPHELETAFKYHSKKNKLELWYTDDEGIFHNMKNLIDFDSD